MSVQESIKIVLERMDTHPDEFGVNVWGNADSKWEWLVSQVVQRVENGQRLLTYMKEEDVLLIYRKIQRLRMRVFENHVLRSILADNKPAEEDVRTQGVYLTPTNRAQNRISSGQSLYYGPVEATSPPLVQQLDMFKDPQAEENAEPYYGVPAGDPMGTEADRG